VAISVGAAIYPRDGETYKALLATAACIATRLAANRRRVSRRWVPRARTATPQLRWSPSSTRSTSNAPHSESSDTRIGYDRDVRVLTTREIIHATPRTRIIRFDLGEAPFAFSAGQAVLVAPHGAPLLKPYSIACSPRQAAGTHTLELLVQTEDSPGIDDPHLEPLKPGSLVDVEGPLGTFGLPPAATETDILFVAGGTGIAPLRSMMWDTIENHPAAHRALIYSVRSADEIAYERELSELAAGGRLDLRVTITRDGPESWLGPRGRVNAALIRSVIRTTDTRALLCGPHGMVNDVTSLLIGAGVAPEKILTETFSS
jgi:ferredoxin-NADP reductase